MGRRGRTIIKLTLGCALFHLVVFSAVFRRPVTQWKKESYDCAVVCGYPACEDGKPSRIMRTRVERAVELWKAGRVGLLLFSGGAAANSFVEADVMKEYAEALAQSSGHQALITDRDHVIAVSGGAKKEWVGRNITSQLEDLIQAREQVLKNQGDGGFVKITHSF